MSRIPILIVDDNPTFLRIATRFLKTYHGDDICVVGAVHSGREALAHAPILRPRIILLDLEMPGLTGLTVIPYLRKKLSDTGIIALTMLDATVYRQAALAAGADDFVSKAALASDLLPAIRRVIQKYPIGKVLPVNTLTGHAGPDTVENENPKPFTGDRHLIHTISVYTGDSEHALFAQAYAIEMACWFEARLRAVSLWGFEDVRRLATEKQDPDHLSQVEFDRLTEKARRAGVCVEQSERGEGALEGLLSEAQESDLLVLGAPRNGSVTDSALAKAIARDERALLRKAECAILLVSGPFRPIRKILVDYQGKIQGKWALRMASELALHCSAALGVLSLDEDVVQAEQYTAVAGTYLEGFPLPQVEKIHRKGEPDSEIDILSVAASWGADLIVIGDEPHGFLIPFLNGNPAEKLILATELPVMIAR